MSMVISSEDLEKFTTPIVIDLLLLTNSSDWHESQWAAMEELAKNGKVRHIGLSGFTSD